MARAKSPYKPRLGKNERAIADALRSGATIIYDRATGYKLLPTNGIGRALDKELAERVIAKRVAAGRGDAMFGERPQSFAFDVGCVRVDAPRASRRRTGGKRGGVTAA